MFTFSLLKRYEEEQNKELELKQKLESINLKTFQNKLKPTIIKRTLELIKNNIEVDPLFAEELYKRNFDVSHQESYINDRIITPFFKHLDSLDYYVKKAMIGEL